MKPTETVELTRIVKALCPHQAIDEYTPDAWHEVLGHLDLADCKEAIREINGRQPFISPSDIIKEIAHQRGHDEPHSQACRAGDCRLCLFGAGDDSWCMHTCHPRAVTELTRPGRVKPHIPAPAPVLAIAGPKRFEPADLRIGRDVE